MEPHRTLKELHRGTFKGISWSPLPIGPLLRSSTGAEEEDDEHVGEVEAKRRCM